METVLAPYGLELRLPRITKRGREHLSTSFNSLGPPQSTRENVGLPVMLHLKIMRCSVLGHVLQHCFQTRTAHL